MKKNLIVSFLCICLILVTAVALDAQPKKVATITFIANVPGAKVYVNDKYLGDTPYANKFPIGNYTLRVTADGYEDYVQPVQFTFDTTINVELKRVQRAFNVSINADARGAKVYINDRFVGQTPYATKLFPGDYSIRLTADGFEDYDKSISINDNFNLMANMNRRIRDFNVSINADARGAKVYINDRFVGQTPYNTRLAQGEYSIRLTAEGFEDYAKNIDVNGDVNLMADMQRRVRDYNINILVNVGGTKIFVDDRLVGTAQYRGRIQEGQHTVRVTADGYEEYVKNVDVNGDVRLSVEMVRIRRLFVLTIEANVDQARVSINGQEKSGFAPMDLKLDEGRYTIKVTRRGYVPFETTVDLKRDTRIEAKLGAPKARIVIQAPERRGPGGLRLVISLDGRPVQGTEFDVERGRHVIRVEAGGMVTEQTVDVREGRTYTFKLVLDLQAPQDTERDFDRDDRGRR